MLYNYSIMPMHREHLAEIAEDVIAQVKAGVTETPLFMMILNPEGNPVIDKAEELCHRFAVLRDILLKEGIRPGILVQASLGHGYEIEPNPYQKYVNLNDGEECFVCCPEDDAFIEHFKGVLRRIAKERPSAIMLDDDFRLMNRPGRGCACPLHMREFNRRAGLSLTREQLWDYISTHSPDDPVTDIFRDIQRDSLVKAATAFRAAIDEIDPTIQGINCTSGNICESVQYTNKIFAGKDNPTIVRVPNGIYAPRGLRGLSEAHRQAAISISKLKRAGIDIILAETDTIPFNRYSKSARFLHAHYLGSVLEGCEGAKHWLTRTSSFELASGRAYRKILGEHKGMYEKLAELSKNIRFVGVNSYYTEQTKFRFDKERFNRYHEEHWVSLNLERMGLPYFFSDKPVGAVFLGGDIANDLSDSEIEAILSEASLFVDGDSAEILSKRGYSESLGVAVDGALEGRISGECYGPDLCSTKQKNSKLLRPLSDKTNVLSYNYRSFGREKKYISPAVTEYARDNGRLSIVFSGSPNATPSYTEGFAFLNESRKAQLVGLLSAADALPVYIVGDDEVSLRAGYLPDGDMLSVVTEIGIDPMDSLRLYLKNEPKSVECMSPDGSFYPVSFTKCGESEYELDIRLEAMYPRVLKIGF